VGGQTTQTAEGVQDFTYLGSQISLTVGSGTEPQLKIGMASGTMQRLHSIYIYYYLFLFLFKHILGSHTGRTVPQGAFPIWGQRHLSLSTKLRLYTTLVLPVLLYDSETWNATKLDLAHLQAFHMRCQRQILRVCWQDHVTNSPI